MGRYKFEMSAVLMEDGPGNCLKLEAFGDTEQEFLKNAYVYDLDPDDNEQLMLHYSRLPDELFAKAVAEMRQVLRESAMREVYRAQ